MNYEPSSDMKSRRSFLRVLGLYVPGLALALPAFASPFKSHSAGRIAGAEPSAELVDRFFVSLVGSLKDNPVTAIVPLGSMSDGLRLADGRTFRVKIVPYKQLAGFGHTYTVQILDKEGQLVDQSHVGPRTTATFRRHNLQVVTQPVSSVSKIMDGISSKA